MDRSTGVTIFGIETESKGFLLGHDAKKQADGLFLCYWDWDWNRYRIGPCALHTSKI